MVMYLGQAADLHMAQLMPLPLTISCSSKSRLVLPFWCWITQVVPDKIQEGHKTVVHVCVWSSLEMPRCQSYQQILACDYTQDEKTCKGFTSVL